MGAGGVGQGRYHAAAALSAAWPPPRAPRRAARCGRTRRLRRLRRRCLPLARWRFGVVRLQLLPPLPADAANGAGGAPRRRGSGVGCQQPTRADAAARHARHVWSRGDCISVTQAANGPAHAPGRSPPGQRAGRSRRAVTRGAVVAASSRRARVRRVQSVGVCVACAAGGEVRCGVRGSAVLHDPAPHALATAWAGGQTRHCQRAGRVSSCSCGVTAPLRSGYTRVHHP